MPWGYAQSQEEITSPHEHLKKAARDLRSFSKGEILADVMQIIEDDLSVTNHFLLIVPELRHYNYKLIEVKQPTFDKNYPASLKLFGTVPQNVVEVKDISALLFENELRALISHPLTRGILGSLKTHIDIARDFRDSSYEKG